MSGVLKKEECLICNSKKTKAYLTVNNYTYYDCLDCKVTFLPNIKIEQQEKNHSGKDYNISRINTESSHDAHNHWLCEEISKIKGFKKNGNLLDVGCGSGFFLNIMKQRGSKVKGIDLGKEKIKFAKEEFDIEIMEKNILNLEEKYDTITMHQLIEHVANPSSFIKKAYESLNLDGLLVITTPNLNFAKFIARFGLLRDGLGHPPNHCVLFKPNHLKRIMRKQGFTDIKIINNPTGLKGNSKYRIAFDIFLNKAKLVGANFMIHGRKV